MHRLNTHEYNYTVADVLGTSRQPADVSWPGGEVEGFDNIAAALASPDTKYALYANTAETLAQDVFASPELKARFLSCATEDAACVQSFANKAGLKLFRRPLRGSELTRYQALYTAVRGQGLTHEAALQQLLRAMLSSAEFLYRIELRGAVAGNRPLDGYELASRLSYFLWSSAPDDAMLQAAGNDGLKTDAAVKETLGRLLKDGKSNRFIESFVGQWLGGRRVLSHPVAAALFPEWTPAAAAAATDEMYFYFSEFLHSDRPWTDFLKADVNFVNAALAPVYAMPGVTGTNLQRVEYGADERKGFFGLAGFLALSSMDRRTSPTTRGRWVLLNMLCTEPPPPIKNIPDLAATGTNLDTGNIREALDKHRTRADCKQCHALFDPFGLALENYDAIGRYRATYTDGTAVDASTELARSDAFPDGAKFTGISGASDAVTSSDRFKSCIAKKLFTYSLGRIPAGDDADWIKLIQHDWASGNLSVPRLVESLVLSTPFRNSGDVQ